MHTYTYTRIYINSYTDIYIYVYIQTNKHIPCVALCCSVLQCIVVCCSVLQCIVTCCSPFVFPSQHQGRGLVCYNVGASTGICTSVGVGACSLNHIAYISNTHACILNLCGLLLQNLHAQTPAAV